MTRYILIDNETGYVFGDTADLPLDHDLDGAPARDHDITPLLAARWLDEAVVRIYARGYEEVNRHSLASNETGYHVYRVDIDGSEAVPVVHDGQDTDTIAAVLRDCQYVTTFRVTPGPLED